MNNIINDIEILFSDASKEVGIMKEIKTRSRKRLTENKPWYTAECEFKRNLYMSARNKYAVTKKNQDRIAMVELNRAYKKCLKQAFRMYKIDFNNRLRLLKNDNPKKYWQLLKDYNIEDEIPISCEDLYNHFKNLSNANVDKNGEDVVLNQCLQNPNGELNKPFTELEIKKCALKLRNNKIFGMDYIINEYIKTSITMLLPIYVQLFNIILETGIIPQRWLEGLIKPLYKKKGSKKDCNNYRGITILSCFSKLFTAVLNDRLQVYLESNKIIGLEQAAFRKGFSTLDHIFSIHCILDLYLAKKKRLYCCYVDYKKAFDLLDRVKLWQKLLSNNINGKFFLMIFNLYNGAKSCVCSSNRYETSDFFNCNIGVRQGENLSPILFSLFLNDLESFLSTRCQRLHVLHQCLHDTCTEEELAGLINMFMLLYADDTVLLSETPKGMQTALLAMEQYCTENKLHVNVDKTKIMIFSRGKIRKLPIFKFEDKDVEIVYSYKYLGVIFNYNGSFMLNIKSLSDVATKAMFSLIQKGKSKCLDVDTLIHLFECTVKPILLYGSEIWGFCNIDVIERVQLRFLKIILGLKKSTPNIMVYGETGCVPLLLSIKTRMVSFWHRLVTYQGNKVSCILYNLFFKKYEKGEHISKWLIFIKSALDMSGMTDIWLTQGQFISTECLKSRMKCSVTDQFKQVWNDSVSTSNSCTYYKVFKTELKCENYLTTLAPKYRKFFTKFRCRNSKLPVVTGAYTNMNREERVCTLCNSIEIGDEYHYIFYCSFFNDYRKDLISNYIVGPSYFTLNMLFNANGDVLMNLCKFIEIIVNTVFP